MNYDDNGNLILTGKLGEAVVNNDFEAFTKAQISGKSEDGLTYQDMADFNEFVSEFFAVGWQRGRGDDEYLVLIRKSDQASFGMELRPHSMWTPGGDAVFEPVQPFTIQGYEPAE